MSPTLSTASRHRGPPAQPAVGRDTGTSVPCVSSPIDVAAERAATPGCATVAHLNNAGAALATSATLDTVIDHLRLEAEIGGYEAEAAVRDRVRAVRASAAALLGCDPDEVAITGSDTEGWTKALWGLHLGGGLPAGGRILVDRIAYDSHYMGLVQASKVAGTTIEAVPARRTGPSTSTPWRGPGRRRRGAGQPHPRGHPPRPGQPGRRGARLCRDAGAVTFVDACQSMGQLPVDVRAIGCDVLTATGRKWLRGPRGTGLVYVRSGFVGPAPPIGSTDARPRGTATTTTGWRTAPSGSWSSRARWPSGSGSAPPSTTPCASAWTPWPPGSGRWPRTCGCSGRRLDGVAVHDGGRVRCGIVTFTVAGRATTEVADAARAAGVNVSVSDRPAARLDLGGARPDGVVRASPHYYNTGRRTGPAGRRGRRPRTPVAVGRGPSGRARVCP